MPEEKNIEVGKVIVNNIFSGYNERVYYAGMPSGDSFSLIFQTAIVKTGHRDN